MSTRVVCSTCFIKHVFVFRLFFSHPCQVASFPWNRLSSSECQPTDMPPSCWVGRFQCEGPHEMRWWLWTQSQQFQSPVSTFEEKHQIFRTPVCHPWTFMPIQIFSPQTRPRRGWDCRNSATEPNPQNRRSAWYSASSEWSPALGPKNKKKMAFDFKISYFWIKEESKFWEISNLHVFWMIPHLAIQKKKVWGPRNYSCWVPCRHHPRGKWRWVHFYPRNSTARNGFTARNVLFHWARELLLDQTIVIFKSPEGSAAFFP